MDWLAVQSVVSPQWFMEQYIFRVAPTQHDTTRHDTTTPTTPLPPLEVLLDVRQAKRVDRALDNSARAIGPRHCSRVAVADRQRFTGDPQAL
jgi:hypothetical protein